MQKISTDLLDYLAKNYDKKVTMKELARRSYYSPAYFSKLFKQCCGKSFTAFVCELRITAAIELLKTTDLSIEDIAFRVGYYDKKNFYVVFRNATKTTPGAFRRQ